MVEREGLLLGRFKVGEPKNELYTGGSGPPSSVLIIQPKLPSF